ncbi:MAG: hypothetical protein AMJ43_06980 [Coxiella sp. DG_40]|nr:MAG: hypothetical protein AMJ43_06980 [Coxiella sp. DG_40]
MRAKVLGPYFVVLAYRQQETHFDSNKIAEFNRCLTIDAQIVAAWGGADGLQIFRQRKNLSYP